MKRSIGGMLQGQFNGNCIFNIMYSVDIYRPVEGDVVKVMVMNINKMGLFCELAYETPSPLSVILAKQHHLNSDEFEKIQVNDIIEIEIIGVKFNFNDKQICCIGRLNGHIEAEEDEEDYSSEEVLLDDEEDEDASTNNSNSSSSNKGGSKDIMKLVGGTIEKNSKYEELELDEEVKLDGEVELENEMGKLN